MSGYTIKFVHRHVSGVTLCLYPKASERGGGIGAKYLGPGLVMGPEILVKRLLMGATVKRIGGP